MGILRNPTWKLSFTDLNNLNGREILCYFIVNLSTTVCYHNLME